MAIINVGPSQLGSLTGYDGKFLLNEVTSDTNDAVVPNPVTWKVATAAAGTFSAVTVAADSTTPTTRSNAPCATLISPRLALVGHNSGANSYVWLRSNNAEETRARSAYPGGEGNGYWTLAAGGLYVIQLASAITTITPAPIALPSLLRSVTNLMAIEADRHFSLHTRTGSVGAYIGWNSGADVLESGDSTKPIMFLASGIPVVAGLVLTAASANCPGYYASTINTIAASLGETVTYYGTGVDGGSLTNSLQSSLSPSLAGAV